jgi:hypothetical protein
MYLIQTDFKQSKIKVNPSDTERLIAVSIDVANHVCGLDITDYKFEAEGRLRVIDSENGNMYSIMIYAQNSLYDLRFGYDFKYDANDEVFLTNSDIFFSNFNLYKDLPLQDTYPDSIDINFYDDFKIYSYEVSYRSVIRHHIYENEEYDSTSVADFTYTVKNKDITLTILYNDWCSITKPEEFFSLTKHKINPEQLIQDKTFLNLLNYNDVGSEAMKDLFGYMDNTQVKTADGFKSAYDYFINHEDKESLNNKIAVIKMENI